jgi:hypothetical protein
VTIPADPGGTFDTDAHRRIMAHLPNPDDPPITVEDLILDRVNRDPNTLTHFADATELIAVLEDLEAAGHAKHLKNGWRNTQSGFVALTGPPTETTTPHRQAMIGLDPAAATSNGDA